MVSKIVAVYDACVLYPAPLRDLLMRIASKDLIQAKWTDMIHEEWIRNVLSNRPDLKRSQLERTRKLMNEHSRDSLIKGFERLIPTLNLPDQDDCHVLAAAIHSCATTIVTFNLDDFPDRILKTKGIKAQHPDNFILRLLDIDAQAVCEAAMEHRASLKNPPVSLPSFLETLKKQGIPKTVARLESLMH